MELRRMLRIGFLCVLFVVLFVNLPIVRGMAIDKPITILCGKYGVRINPRWGWSVDKILYEGKGISKSNGSYDFVVRFSDGVYLGDTHVKPEHEEVVEHKLMIDGQVVEIGKEGYRYVAKEEAKFVKVSKLRVIKVQITTTVRQDGIYRNVSVNVQKDIDVKLVFPFMFVWDTTSTEWLACNLNDTIISGKFVSDKGWCLQKDVKWSAVYDPTRKIAIVTSFDKASQKGKGRHHCYWDHTAYHKQYYQAFNRETLPEGSQYEFGVKCFVVPIGEGEKWNEAVLKAMKYSSTSAVSVAGQYTAKKKIAKETR